MLFRSPVVNGISFDIRRGETFALVGESGSGKSMTALSILRLLPEAARIAAGSVTLGDRDLLAMPEAAMRDVRGRRIAMIFQEPATSLNPVLTIGHQIIEVLERHTSVRGAAAELGRHVVTIAADDDGMRPDALEAACGSGNVQLIYLNPTLQNPTTHTMPEARRRDIARVARQHGVLIVEDDPYWLLTPDAPPPLAAIDPGQTVYIATLAKCLSPGLRTAYVVAPDGELQESILAALRAITLMASPIATALATQWIRDGSAAELLEEIGRAHV